MYKVLSMTAALAMVLFYASPALAAGDVNVSSTNSADVSNNIVVTADTGSNVARGGRSAAGARGGDADGNRAENDAGDGGNGGNGGDGGSVITGDAISTAAVTNDINTTDTDIHVTDGVDDRYNETLRIDSRQGSEAGAEYHRDTTASQSSDVNDSDSSYDQNSNSSDEYDHSESDIEHSSDTDGEDSDSSFDRDDETSETAHDIDSTTHNSGADSSHSSSNDTGFSESVDESSNAANHNNYSLYYNREYVGDAGESRDVVTSTTNTATVRNNAEVAALTGNNASRGEDGAAAGAGGSADGNDSNSSAGNGGDGGDGGNGGVVRTGASDSLADIATVLNHHMTRIVRR
jgi:hypothetical protein